MKHQLPPPRDSGERITDEQLNEQWQTAVESAKKLAACWEIDGSYPQSETLSLRPPSTHKWPHWGSERNGEIELFPIYGYIPKDHDPRIDEGFDYDKITPEDKRGMECAAMGERDYKIRRWAVCGPEVCDIRCDRDGNLYEVLPPGYDTRSNRTTYIFSNSVSCAQELPKTPDGWKALELGKDEQYKLGELTKIIETAVNDATELERQLLADKTLFFQLVTRIVDAALNQLKS
jgi:hypothetical protein